MTARKPSAAPRRELITGVSRGLGRAMAEEFARLGHVVVGCGHGVIDTAMLRSCFGDGAAGYPGPEEWAQQAAPFLLSLGPRHNGKPLTV